MAEQEEEQRRLYSELSPVEKAIVAYALPRHIIDREKVVELLVDDFSEKSIQDGFTMLKQENRLFRKGNKSEYVMIRRDLF